MKLPARPLWYTAQDAAEVLGTNSKAIHRLIDEGYLPHARLPHERRPVKRIPKAALERLLADMDADAAHSLPARIGPKRRRAG